MSKSTRVTEEELAKTIGLDRSEDHPLNIGRSASPIDSSATPLSTPLSGGFSSPEKEPRPEQKVATRRVAAAPAKPREFITQSPEPEAQQGRGEVSSGPKKADLYPRRIGIGMNDELKSELDSLTAQVQALRTTKSERHTTNTVVRCALRYVLENIQFYEGDTADSEEELTALFNERLKGLRD